ncbi:AAA family ATPase [Haliangium sp.]|uniref:AAA family ATPase n=1 Tax=Haliangium sp. TaxID=2663208 RepID=UPI003D0A8987
MLAIGSICGERFRIVEAMELVWPGMGRFIADDLDGGESVVLHAVTARQVAPATRLRVADEAVVAAELRAPALIPVIAVGGDDDVLYHAMPRVAGTLLADRLGQGPLSVAETVRVAMQIATALSSAHERGLVHRSITPSHVLLGGDDQARLEGFGCIRPPDLESNDSALALHRARYASPEEAGLLQAGVDGRADLYSLGVMLFQCLTGRLPFEGDSVGELLRLHLTAPAPSVRQYRRAVPRVVDELVGRLLQKAPEQRYQSARAVVSDLRSIQSALERGDAEPELVLGLADRRHALTQPSFVGRSSELAALERQLAAAKLGKGSLVVVEAQSGGGKSRLLEELALRATQDGMWVLSGGGVAEGGVPYQILQGLADESVRQAASDPALAARLRAHLGDRAQAACEALPTLRSLLPDVAERDFGLDAGARERTREALAHLLGSLGSPERPAVVLIDDAQWLDSSTLDVIAAWADGTGTEGAVSYTVLVLATRSEDGDAVRPLRAAASLCLAPLDEEAIHALLSSMAGALPARAVALVTRLSGGSPFLAASLLRALVDSGALVRERAGWMVREHALADAQSSADAAALLQRRLDQLADESRAVLQIAAVLGRRFDAYLVASLSGRDRRAVKAQLDEACRQQILWADPSLTSYQFVHNKLREAVLDRLPEDERRAIHAAAARELERMSPRSARDIAYHFDAGGDSARALPYALEAAEEAHRRHALETAEAFYDVALRGMDGADAHSEQRVRQRLADVLVHQGHFERAEARALSSSHDERVAVESQLGKLAYQRGHFDTAVEHYRRSVRMRGLYVPARTAVSVLLLLWEVLVQVLHVLVPRLFVGRRALARSERDFAIVADLLRLSYAAPAAERPLVGLWCILRAVNVAERYPPSATLGESYTLLATVIVMILGLEPTKRYAQAALDDCLLGNLYQEGLSHSRYAHCLYMDGQWRACLDHAKRAIHIYERAAETYERGAALFFMSMASLQIGRLREAASYAERLYQQGVALKDTHAFAFGLLMRSMTNPGQLGADDFARDVPRVLDNPVRAIMLGVGEGLAAYYRGDRAAAVAAFARTLEDTDRLSGMAAATVGAMAWYATALRRAAEETPIYAGEERRALLARARRVARLAYKGGRKFPIGLPHALRELGILAAIEGEPARARRLLDRSLAEAQRLGSRLEAAYSLWMRGEIGSARGWAGAEADLAHGRALLRELGAGHVLSAESTDESIDSARPSLSLIDRFAAVQEQGRRIASALTRDAVFAAVYEAGATLLRGERTAILVRDEGAEPAPGSDEDPGGWSVILGDEPPPGCRALVARAAGLGRPTAAASAELGDAGGVRSALCAPLEARGRCVALLLVVHCRIADLFGEEEYKLSEFIATLAGAALENAAGFAEVEELGRTLERRVAERTNELAATNSKLEGSLHQLHDAQTLLLRASREAGMAEVAVSVLHNVGNVLNSLTVSTSLLAEKLDKSFLPGLTHKTAALLEEQRANLAEFLSTDARGQKLPALVISLAHRLAAEYGDFRGEIARVREQVEHIARIVRAQQSYARRTTLTEQVAVNSVVEEALGLCADRLDVYQVTVVRELAELTEVELDRHKLLQVLINLVSNAVDALDDCAPEARRITLRTGYAGAESGSPSAIRIEVEDNGRGISADTLAKIFHYGFSTKPDGHGFGLHTSALSVQEQGGSLRATSDGPGKGACFIIELPIAAAAHDRS